MDDSTYCTNCKKITQVAFDDEIICRGCGLVLGAYFIDGASDFNRVGAATNHGHLTTTISKPGQMYWGWLKPNRTMIRGFNTIATMSDKLCLAAPIKSRANQIYNRIADRKSFMRTKKQDAVLAAACVYIACGEEPKPRTLKEICSVANGATEKEICSFKKNIDEFLEKETSLITPIIGSRLRPVEEFVASYCALLQMQFSTTRAAREVAKNLEQIDKRSNNPSYEAAAVVYMITQLSTHDKRCLKDISNLTVAEESTIRDAYKDVYPYASRLIPTWYAQESDLNILASP